MVLEDSLKELQNLNVGSVEKAIENIAESLYEYEKDYDALSLEIEGNIKAYSECVMKKLPRILSNVFSLTELVKKAGSLHHVFPYSKPGELSGFFVKHRKIGEFKKNKGIVKRLIGPSIKWVPQEVFYLGLAVNYIKPRVNNSSYGVWFTFDEQTNLLEDISVQEHANRPWFFRKKLELFGAKNSYEFAERYLKVITDDFRKYGDSRFETLLFVLNQVSDIMPKIINEKIKKDKKTLENIEFSTELKFDNISSLEISDF